MLSQMRAQFETTRVELDKTLAENTRLQLEVVGFRREDEEERRVESAEVHRMRGENAQLLEQLHSAEESAAAAAAETVAAVKVAAAAEAAVAGALEAGERAVVAEEVCSAREKHTAALLKDAEDRLGDEERSYHTERNLTDSLKAKIQKKTQRVVSAEQALAQSSRENATFARKLTESDRVAQHAGATILEMAARLAGVEDERGRACGEIEELRARLRGVEEEAKVEKISNTKCAEERERLAQEVTRLVKLVKSLWYGHWIWMDGKFSSGLTFENVCSQGVVEEEFLRMNTTLQHDF